MKTKILTGIGASLISMWAITSQADVAATIKYDTVVNNGDIMPNSSKHFNAYNQPSVNKNGLVVLRARSKGEEGSGGKPTKGIYTRDMKKAKSSEITKVIDGDTLVPSPNSEQVTFTETPSFPRIDRNSNSFAFRGMSKPILTYTPEGGTETKIGTTGIFMQPKNTLITGVNQLGVVPDFAYFTVPGEDGALKFDMFPGAPSPVTSLVAFKGNYTVVDPVDSNLTESKTGVYFRSTKNDNKKLKSPLPVVLIAHSGTNGTVIPNGNGTAVFGSTAPPSAAGKYMVFAGFDNEDNPTMGGIYRAQMKAGAAIETLVGIGQQVPGEEEGAVFTRLSEGVSFNGRFVGFWGAWGTGTKQRTLACPNDGNQDVIAYCQANDNNKVVDVPADQGFFVHDTKNGATTMVARTGLDNFDDFVYWNYSGHPPASTSDEEGDAELPRWRSSSFISVDTRGGKKFRAVFKGTKTGETAVTGLYLSDGPSKTSLLDSHVVIADTSTQGVLIDADVGPLDAVSGDTLGPLFVSSVGIERDSLHNNWLAFNASMVNSDASVSWAGVYVARLPRVLNAPVPTPTPTPTPVPEP